MSECRQPISGRLPPHVEGPVGRVADRLRTANESLDEVTQARMERAVLEQVRVRAARPAQGASGSHRRPSYYPARPGFPSSKGRSRARVWYRRLAYPALVAAAAAAGALLVLMVHTPRQMMVSTDGSAHFEMYLPDGAVQRGSVSEGQTLESGRQSHIQIALDRSRVELSRRSRVRFDQLSPSLTELTVGIGRVEIGFHPRVRGKQRMLVQTRAARIRVVGTRFTVDVDGQGNTRVRVSEGVVEVRPRYGGPTHFVGAGQDLEVMADAGDDGERAVRDTLAANLSKLAATSPSDPSPAGDGAASAPVAPSPHLGDAARGGEPAQAAPPVELPAVRVRSVVGAALPPPSARDMLEVARERLRLGRHAQARGDLHKLAVDAGHPKEYRAEAWTLIAESYTAQGNVPRAREAYRAASAVAPELGVGHNALFALARLLDRYTTDRQAAVLAYEDYLRQVPEGALASQARHALCRLGGYPEHCDHLF
ncbi:MAG: FecR domain-containing protein [Myxococcales bacterium]|nr:FecR domain-containing protein [Myxococcales bacterium]MDD9967523.1 FecR domain-containing protein [Myxococcales bacterium]